MGDEGEASHPLQQGWRSILNRVAVCESEVSGCYACKRIFSSPMIREWCDDGRTACCPYCHVDAVVPESGDLEITPEWLTTMHDYWMKPHE